MRAWACERDLPLPTAGASSLDRTGLHSEEQKQGNNIVLHSIGMETVSQCTHGGEGACVLFAQL